MAKRGASPAGAAVVSARSGWRAAAAVVGLSALVAACSPQPATTTVPPATSAPATTAASTTSIAPGPVEPTGRDRDYAEAYRYLMGLVAGDVWPGWGTPIPPLLQRGDEAEYLVGHPDPPAPFAPTGLTAGDAPIWSAPAGTLTPGPQATTWQVEGVWSAMIPLRQVFERAVADVLGPDAVEWDDAVYLRAMAHEAFHAHQLATRPEFPDFGSGATDEGEAVAALGGIADLEARYAREARLLAEAVEAPDLAEARAAARSFLDARRDRRSLATPAVGAYEKLIEWAEGPARYADLELLSRAGETAALPEGLMLPGADEVIGEYLDDLRGTTSRADGMRGWWQALGSAQCLLLDRLSPGWEDQVLVAGRPLEELVAEAVSVPTPLAGLRTGWIGLGTAELLVAFALTPGEWSSGLAGVEALEPLDGMLFVFPEDSGGAAFHMEGALIPLDIAFFSEDGGLLDVATMPLCAGPPCPVYRPEGPYRSALEAPAGSLTGLAPAAALVLPPGL